MPNSFGFLSFSIKKKKKKRQRKPPHLLNLLLNPTSCKITVDPKITQKKHARNWRIVEIELTSTFASEDELTITESR
jgi:hypothetical protein